MRARPWLIIGAVAVLVAAGRLWRPHPPIRVSDWPITSVPADSVARNLERVIGAPPAALTGCGPHRLRIYYVDAPIDIRPEFNELPDGRTAQFHSLAQQTRHPIAQMIATIAWSAVGRNSGIDTITVTLERRRHKPAGYGADVTDFSFVPDSITNRRPDHQFIGSENRACGRLLPPG